MAKRRIRKKIIRKIFIGFLFLLSFGILLYPTVSTLWNEYRSRQLISEYKRAAETLETEEYDAIRKEAEEYNLQHTSNTIIDAFDEENNYVLTHPYDTLLNPSGNGVMGYIEIPKINQTLVIYHGTGAEELEQGVGHVEGTSLPIGGENTHSVLAGHRGLPNAKLFTDLDLIQKGDRFFLHIMNETLAYEVEDIFTVLPDQTEYLAIEEGRDLCTLITCTPYGVNSHRLLVRGSRIPYTEEQISEETKKADFLDRMDISLKALLFGIAAMVIIWLVLRLKRRRNEKTS